MKIVLVRHGQSTWNLERRLQGQTMQVPLTDLGHAQAGAAAAVVASHVAPGTPLLCSDQLRAVQTAEHVATAIGSTPEPTRLLREQGLGSMEGKGFDELVAEATPDGMHVSEVCWGGGESIQQVHARSRELLDELVARALPEVVLVGHGDALRVLLAAIDGRGHREVEWGSIGNGEVLVRTWQGWKTHHSSFANVVTGEAARRPGSSPTGP